MIHDEDLKSSHDYSEGQTAAAHRVLIELVNLFHEYIILFKVKISVSSAVCRTGKIIRLPVQFFPSAESHAQNNIYKICELH